MKGREGRGYLFLGNAEGKIGDVNEILLNDSNIRKILPANLVLLLSLLLLLLLPGKLLRDSAIITSICEGMKKIRRNAGADTQGGRQERWRTLQRWEG
jgi:hypothetical protein